MNGESRSTSPMRQRGDIDGRQQKSINDKEKSVSSSSGSTDDELFQLHNIYKESSLLDENPMLEKKRPTIDTSISKKVSVKFDFFD